MTICVVDPDPSTGEALRRAGGALGQAVLCYPSAEAFLDQPLPGDAACIVTELELPGMDGLALFASLRSRGIQIPVFFLTAHGDIRDAVSAMRGGAISFLRKPVRMRALVSDLRKIFENQH